jgi:hypothetical protein
MTVITPTPQGEKKSWLSNPRAACSSSILRVKLFLIEELKHAIIYCYFELPFPFLELTFPPRMRFIPHLIEKPLSKIDES